MQQQSFFAMCFYNFKKMQHYYNKKRRLTVVSLRFFIQNHLFHSAT